MSEVLKVTSPYDGHFISELQMTDEAAAEQMLATAHKLYRNRNNWLKPDERIAILEKVARKMSEQSSALTLIAAEEGGKPFLDTKIEVARATQGVKLAIESMGHVRGEQIPMGLTTPSRNRMAFTFREPIGVTTAISAFNHPLNLIIHQVIPAVAVGCPVLIKPASTTPLSCFNFVKMLYDAGLPEEWVQPLVCNRHVAEKLVTDPRTAYFSFIGSGGVGWSLFSKLAPGTRAGLEHGGVAPVIVEPDADIDSTLPLLAKGGFYHAGQVCVSVQRIYVHESRCDQLANGLAELAQKLVVGDPLDEKTEVGPLILPEEVNRIHEWVEEAAEKGGQILCGGQKISDTCYAPTVILNPPDDVRVSTHEVFGPVVCVYSYQNRLEAIERANSLPYSFQAAIFTQNIDVALDTVQRLDATAVMVNDHTAFRVDWMPFGGRKASGLGLGGIPYSMHELTQEKLMVLKSPLLP